MDSRLPTALVIEDDLQVAKAIGKVVSTFGYQVTLAGTVREAQECLTELTPSLILVDVRLPDGNGLKMLRDMSLGHLDSGGDPSLNVSNILLASKFIVITGDQTQETAIDSLRLHAHDLLQKPFELSQLQAALERLHNDQHRTTLEKPENSPSESANRKTERSPMPVDTSAGEADVSAGLRRILKLVAETAYPAATIMGDTGVDKFRLAELIHRRSARRGELVSVNCAAESGERGHRRFFGVDDLDNGEIIHRGYVEQAAAGTLVLDDITRLPQDLQARLVHLIDYGLFTRHNGVQLQRVKLGIIGIARTPVNAALDDGLLLPDFAYRLQQFTVQVPRLVQRGEDSIMLAEQFVAELNKESGCLKNLSKHSQEVIRKYSWPGNLSEMRNVISEAYQRFDTNIDIDEIPNDLADATTESVINDYVGKTVWELERDLLLATMEHNDNDKSRVAEVLGVSLKTLYNRLNAYS